MCRIIAIANQKGGVGKTTTCVNLGIGLARAGKKVLLVEADAQGSMAVSLGIQEPDELDVTLVNIMEKVINDEDVEPGEGIIRHEEGIDFIPANIELAGLETSLVNVMSREQVLRLYLEGVKADYAYSHEIIGPLGHGVGVCEGIAKSVKVLCDALGVWCIIAICGNNPEKGIKYRHTWNIVRINGQYYHLDATFDNTLGKNEDGLTSIRYDYFNLDDKNIFRDHEPLIAPAPPCPDGNHFYYREKKLSFTKLEDVYKRALQAAKKGREFTFHWRGGYLTREVLADLVDQIQAAGKTRDKKAIITLNWPQAVLRFHFVEQQAEGKVFIEEVNEGEKL